MMKMKQNRLVFYYTFLLVICVSTFLAKARNSKATQVKVGLVLDLDTKHGKMDWSCINMSLSDFYSSHSHYNTRLQLHSRDASNDVVGAAAAALDLIKNVQVQAILGPATSMQANFVINLGDEAKVPIISFTATSPSLTSLRTQYFFRFAQNDSSQVQAISAIVKAFGWRQVVPIYVDNEFGEGIIPYLADALQDVDARIPYRSVIPLSASDDQIKVELYKLMTMQTRVFVVHVLPSLASRIFTIAKEIEMMKEGYVWIMTDATTNILSSINASTFDSMQGVLGIKTYVPSSKELDNFTSRWKWKFRQENPTIDNLELDVFAIWAYDATWALALAVEKAGTTNLTYQKSNESIDNLTDLGTFGVSLNGPNLHDALSNIKFKGLSGDINFVNGQLQSLTFQIVNINGRGERSIGFWTPQTGLTRVLSTTGQSSTYSTSKDNLGSIIWVGDATTVPKGWEIPTNGKKLRVGVPAKDGFSEFVKVSKNLDTNKTEVTGYCIEVFKAVLEELPYAVIPDFIPFTKPNATYDELIYQVYLGEVDAVVGDVTIIANRSKYVDFTLPYTESGVTMVVPIRDDSNKNAWVFLKPLSWDLWVTSGCFFMFIGFVVWVLEHRINEDFRGPPSHQIGTSLWFSFSTMVFAQRETIVSNMARFVVVIWFFVVLILTQSYTASLTSLLTVQQLQSTVTDVNQLLRNNEKVGYQDGSFVYGVLKSLKFDDNQLVNYSSAEELDALFSKGSANGGIAAAFDEIPYIKLFLSNYCSKYTTQDPTYKTDGFGFVFPIGSPLVGDISRAILNVTEGDKMRRIEEPIFAKKSKCSSPSTTEVTSTSLSLGSFWGLFLIAGLASVLALIIFFLMFLRKEKQILQRGIDSESSVWKRIGTMLKIYDEKDLTSHTFRKSSDFAGGVDHGSRVVPVEASPSSTNYPHSPISNYSIQTDSNAESFRDQGRNSFEFADPSHSGRASTETSPVIELSTAYNNNQEAVGMSGSDEILHEST